MSLKLRKLHWHRTDGGRRILRVTVRAGEDVTVRARVARNGRRLSRRRFTGVESGTHRLAVPIPSHVRGGVARLVLYAQDAAGNTKIVRRTIHIPRRS